MAAGTIFDFVAETLERSTDFDKLEARGTVRLALKESGLDAKSISRDQMKVVLQKVLPGELKTRGVEAPEAVCEALVRELESSDLGSAAGADQSPEAVFKRIGGG